MLGAWGKHERDEGWLCEGRSDQTQIDANDRAADGHYADVENKPEFGLHSCGGKRNTVEVFGVC